MSGRRRTLLKAAAAPEDGRVAPAISAPTSQQAHSWTRQTLAVVGVLLCLAVSWEGVKGVGGDPWRLSIDDGALINMHFQPPLSFAFASDFLSGV